MKHFTNLIIASLILFSLVGCKKQDKWLNAKTNKSDVVPETLEDYQAILDNTLEMNKRGFTTSGIVSSDNIFVPDNELPNMGEDELNIYLWNKDVWVNGNSNEWNYGYRMIEFSNLILDALRSYSKEDKKVANIVGQAYFFRAAAMYNLVQLFCLPYTKNDGELPGGLPIRESSDVNIIIRNRSTVKDTYEKIILDLKSSINLLPSSQPYKQRPSIIASKALLSKVYLSMEDYTNAELYSSDVLKENNNLLDFNSSKISSNSIYPFPINGVGNPEILFYAETQYYGSVRPWDFSPGIITEELFSLYDTNDLRKSLFFTTRNNTNRLNGTYTGTFSNFSGFATNEIYLIKSECLLRNGKLEESINLLNELLLHRYKTGTFKQLSFNNPDDALREILKERRKELPFTGNIRWEDLRRLNQDPRFRKTITRVSRNVTYSLPPNDKRYVLPIPETELSLSGINQNLR